MCIRDRYYPPLTSKQAAEEVGKIKHYFLNKKDAVGLNLICELQTHIEKTLVQKLTVQTKVSNYFKPMYSKIVNV